MSSFRSDRQRKAVMAKLTEGSVPRISTTTVKPKVEKADEEYLEDEEFDEEDTED